MTARKKQLENTLIGFKTTGILLIEKDIKLIPSASGLDDVGSFVFIPLISNNFKLSINHGIDIFYSVVTLFAFILGSFFLVNFLDTPFARFYGIVMEFFIFFESWKCGDVYVIAPSLVSFIIPIFFYLFCKKLNYKIIYSFLFLCGITLSSANYIRTHSGTGILIFIILFILLNKNILFSKKLFSIIFLFLGYLSITLYFNHIIEKRDSYLQSVEEKYKPRFKSHFFWFPTYLGLGFLDNNYGIKWNDSIGVAKLNSLDKRYKSIFDCDSLSEHLLKQEFFKILINDPKFVVYTFFSKLGIIILHFIIAVNIGLYYLVKKRLSLKLYLVFISTIIFYSLYGLIGYPLTSYLLGFMAISSLFSVFLFSLNNLNNCFLENSTK